MKKENNKKIGLIVLGIVVLAGVFYGGMVYGKNSIPVRGQGNQAFGQNGAGGTRGLRNGGIGGFTTGEIISKDDKSITVKLGSGGPATAGQVVPAASALAGSKIIFLDSNTKISKSVVGSAADLATGTQVSVTGTPNPDGSINAQNVQIRPAAAGTVVR